MHATTDLTNNLTRTSNMHADGILDLLRSFDPLHLAVGAVTTIVLAFFLLSRGDNANATQFQGAHGVHIGGHATLSNTGVNKGEIDNKVDNSGQNKVDTKHGNTNIGDGQAVSDNSIKFGNDANFSGASAVALGASSKATRNSNNKTTNNTTNNRGKNSYNMSVGTQYGNTNAGDGQHNGGGTYNFNGKQ